MRYVISSKVFWKCHGDGVAVWEVFTKESFELKGSAEQLWRLLETPRSANELVLAIIERYDVNHTRAESDIRIFLDDMYAKGLIEEYKTLPGYVP